MKRTFAFNSLAVAAALLIGGTGCKTETPPPAPPATTGDTKADEHDHAHHNHADNLAGAVKELTDLKTTIADAFAKGDADAAHDPLHEIGHVLENIPVFATKENVAEAEQATIKEAVDALLDVYGKIDEGMHGKEGVKYEDVSAKIDEALAKLTGALPKAQ